MYAFMPVNWGYMTYGVVMFLKGDLMVKYRRRVLGDSLLPSWGSWPSAHPSHRVRCCASRGCTAWLLPTRRSL